MPKRNKSCVESCGTGLLDKFLPKRKNDKYPPKVRNLIQQYGDQKITAIKVCRDPLNSGIKRFFNVITFGGVERARKEMGYDELYHLYMIITLASGQRLKLEKNQVINMKKVNNVYPESDMDVAVTKDVTLNELMTNVATKIGAPLYEYNIVSNNCQLFVNNVLGSSGLLTPEIRSFVSQDAQKLLAKSPTYAHKLANLLTDTAARVDRLIEGEGKKRAGKKRPPLKKQVKKV